MLAPAQESTPARPTCCATVPRRRTYLAAHTAQSVNEFQEMIRHCHSHTPVVVGDIAVALSEPAIIGHGIFLDHHPLGAGQPRGPAPSASSKVAHCPTVFMRRAVASHLRRLCAREWGSAPTPIRIAGGDAQRRHGRPYHRRWTTPTRPRGGAQAMRRDDIGKLAVGCRADMVCVD
ncbi:MAG: hypothetical protein ACMVO3_00095 [Thalassobaculum sp.]